MTGYRIGKTVIHNFLAFADATFDFSLPGLTVVEGRIRGVPGCDSNGSGKSALLEAPVWAITGKTIREECSGDKVIRNGTNDGCFVDVTIRGPKTIRIVRYRGHSTHGNKVMLYVDGRDVSRGTSVQTDVAIESELGLDFDTFLNTVAFGARAEVRSFFFATDTERKRIMDKLLGLEVYERAHDLAKDQLHKCAKEFEPLSREEVSLGFAITEKSKVIDDLCETPTYDIVDIQDQQLIIKAKDRQIASMRADLVAAKQIAGEAEQKHRDALRRHDRALEQYQRDRESALREITTKLAEATTHDTARTKLKVRADQAAKHTDTDCPTCFQPITKSSSKHVSSVLLAQAQEHYDAAKTLREQADALRSQLEQIKRPEPPPVDSAKNLSDNVREIEHAIRLIESEKKQVQERLRSMREVFDNITNKLTAYSAERDRLQERRTQNLDKQVKLKEQMADLDFWVSAFGNSGIKSFVIESELPKINETATRYARRLLGDGAFVRIRSTTRLKTQQSVEREKMQVEAGIPGCAQSYANASKGQRRRLDLALILAFRAVVSARSSCPFDQLFADELFDGVDATGVDCVVEILKEVSAKCPVILVTHDAMLSSAGDRRTLVTHNGEFASIG